MSPRPRRCCTCASRGCAQRLARAGCPACASDATCASPASSFSAGSASSAPARRTPPRGGPQPLLGGRSRADKEADADAFRNVLVFAALALIASAAGLRWLFLAVGLRFDWWAALLEACDRSGADRRGGVAPVAAVGRSGRAGVAARSRRLAFA